jgi:diacylglycerol kinase
MPEVAAARVLRSALRNAWRGIATTWHEETTFRIEVFVGTLALALSLWLREGTVVVVAFAAAVLALELLNTALERLADALHPTDHPLVGAAKDASAGAVAVVAAAALLAGLLVLGPPLLERLAGFG